MGNIALATIQQKELLKHFEILSSFEICYFMVKPVGGKCAMSQMTNICEFLLVYYHIS